MSTGLLTLALVISAPGPTGLQKGDQFTFAGLVVESVDRPGDRSRREHEITLRVFVLERHENWADAAVLTKLRRCEDAVGGLAKPVTGTGPDRNAPPRIQLDIVRIHTDGTVHLLLPTGVPFRLDDNTPAAAVPSLSLNSYSPSELGVFPPRTPRSAGPGEPWTVAAGPNRPNEVWVAKKLEFINAEQCQRLVMNQQSADWEHPVGGQTSWHRADEVWVSTLDGTARQVLRVIRQRDGLSKDLDAAVRIQVEYELKEHEKLSGRTYDRTRRDIEVAYNALVEGSTLVRDGTKLGPRFFESKLTKLDAYLEESEPGTPFREAIIAARRSLEAARRGDVAPQPTPTQTPIGVSVVPWPQPGQLAPPLRYGNASLAERRGKPVVLVFFKPDSETTDLALAIADALQKRYGEDAPVIALSLGDVATALKDRNRLKLTVPIHEGLAAAAAYGVETVPRFALIDPDGKVKWTFTGVGAETGFLLREQVERLIRPGPPNGPGGIIPAPGSTTTPVIPRP